MKKPGKRGLISIFLLAGMISVQDVKIYADDTGEISIDSTEVEETENEENSLSDQDENDAAFFAKHSLLPFVFLLRNEPKADTI